MGAICWNSAAAALAAARAAGIKVSRDGDRICLEALELPDDVVALFTANKPDVMRLLAYREAARAVVNAALPDDCSPQRWAEARLGLQHFVTRGWGDQAALFSWTIEELYRLPSLWSQIHLTGAALLIGERRVVAITVAAIVIETPRTGSRLKVRRLGREHIA